MLPSTSRTLPSQTYDWDSNVFWSFKATVDATAFQSFITSLQHVTDTCSIKITDTLLQATATNHTKSVIYDIDTQSVHMSDGRLAVSVPVSELAQYLPQTKGDNAEYTLRVQRESDTTTLKIAQYKETVISVSEPQTAPELPSIPNTQYNDAITIQTPKIREMLTGMTLDAESTITVSSIDDSIEISTTRSENESYFWNSNLTINTDSKQAYRATDIISVINAFPEAGTITVKFRDNKPLHLVHETGIRGIILPVNKDS